MFIGGFSWTWNSENEYEFKCSQKYGFSHRHRNQNKKVRKKQNYCGNANKVLCPCGKYTTFLDAAISCAISSAVSILLNSTRPSPASPINEIILKLKSIK